MVRTRRSRSTSAPKSLFELVAERQRLRDTLCLLYYVCERRHLPHWWDVPKARLW